VEKADGSAGVGAWSFAERLRGSAPMEAALAACRKRRRDVPELGPNGCMRMSAKRFSRVTASCQATCENLALSGNEPASPVTVVANQW
jgi:hypothetical protein